MFGRTTPASTAADPLPSQRYYTLASDESGDDNLTLLAELRAYRDPTRQQVCTILDTRYPPGEALARTIGYRTQQSLLIAFFDDAAKVSISFRAGQRSASIQTLPDQTVKVSHVTAIRYPTSLVSFSALPIAAHLPEPARRHWGLSGSQTPDALLVNAPGYCRSYCARL